MNGTIQATGLRQGVVVDLSPGYVTVRIQQQSACQACHARAYCVSSECTERELRLESGGHTFALGEIVMISAEERVGRLAVLLAFVLPLLLLVGSLALMQVLYPELNEGLSVLATLSLLAGYYLILYTCRERLGKRLHLEVLPLSSTHD